MDVVKRAEHREELSDGLRLQFAPSSETIALIAQAVNANGTAAASFDSRSRLNPMVDRCSWISPDRQERETSSTPYSTRDYQRRIVRAGGVLRNRRLLRVLGVAAAGQHSACRARRHRQPYRFRLRVDSCGFRVCGKAYAAYGGIYIVASLAWLWVVEGQAPTRTDLAGAALAVAGALVIIGFASRTR